MAKNTRNLNKRLTIWAAVVAGILMIPLVTQAPWSLGDYVVAGVVLFGAASGYEVVASKLKNPSYRWNVVAIAIGGVILIWVWAVA